MKHKISYVDLSYALGNGMFKYPSDPEAEIEIKKASTEEKEEFGWSEGDMNPLISTSWTLYKSGYSYFKQRSHHGTHIDVPSHKLEDGKTISDYGIEKFVNRALLLDLTSTDILKRETKVILPKDIEPLISPNSEIGALVIYTGFCE
jgi:kynurenine formamidase